MRADYGLADTAERTSRPRLAFPPAPPHLSLNSDPGGSPAMTQFVSICEVGPRDGLQIAKTRMTTDDKVAWIASIAAAGVREIEVGSFVPPRVIPQLADTPEIVARVLATVPGLTVQALAPNLRGVQNAYNAGVHKISIP